MSTCMHSSPLVSLWFLVDEATHKSTLPPTPSHVESTRPSGHRHRIPVPDGGWHFPLELPHFAGSRHRRRLTHMIWRLDATAVSYGVPDLTAVPYDGCTFLKILVPIIYVWKIIEKIYYKNSCKPRATAIGSRTIQVAVVGGGWNQPSSIMGLSSCGLIISRYNENFFIFFLKLFCKIIRWFKNLHFSHPFVVAHGGRRGPRRFQYLPSCATTVRLSPWGTQWPTTVACGIPPWPMTVSFFN
jgi:hypothetical protein